jgi:CheY-like chemotaxis protein
MQVLIVDASSQDRDLARRYLEAEGHEVSVAAEAQGALAALEKRAPEIVVLDSLLAGMPAIQLIERVRQKETATRAYVILVSARPAVTELTAAIQAGADDYMRKPLNREELVIRVGALARIKGWAAKVFGGTASVIDLGNAEITRLQAWQKVDRSIMKDMSGLIGQTLAPPAPTATVEPCVIGAQIPLTLAAENTEVRLTVGVDQASIPALCELCLGDPGAPVEALRDVLREFANTAGGAFLRTASQEGVSLTSGLPVDLTADSFSVSEQGASQRFVVATRTGSVHVSFALEVLSRALRRVNVTQLTEGMVVARDLHTEAGAILVPAGTRLTSSQIRRMNEVLARHVTFDVAEAA